MVRRRWGAEEERCAKESYIGSAATARYAAEEGAALRKSDGEAG